MAVISPINVIEGASSGNLKVGTAPTAGVTAVQTITKGDATGGTQCFTINGEETAPLGFACTAAELKAALEALKCIGSTGVLIVGGTNLGANPLVVTFHASAGVGRMAGMPVPAITVTSSALTGGTSAPTGNVPTVAQTTAGVKATGRGCPKGTILEDTANGIAYVNTGTAVLPAWTKVGTQS